MKLAPTSDDIWFWLQGLRNGYKVVVVDKNNYALNYIPGSQDVSLCHINDGNNHKVFFEHLMNIIGFYPELNAIFETDRLKNDQIVRNLINSKSRKDFIKKILKKFRL